MDYKRHHETKLPTQQQQDHSIALLLGEITQGIRQYVEPYDNDVVAQYKQQQATAVKKYTALFRFLSDSQIQPNID
ncbi:hypothetical protein D3C75_1219370 [compost metagenome]